MVSYRKRIRIAPGVHLNVSKSGISTTIGRKGFSVTSGSRGTYLNTSIPGTGIYNRQKIVSQDTSYTSRKNRTSMFRRFITIAEYYSVTVFICLLLPVFFSKIEDYSYMVLGCVTIAFFLYICYIIIRSIVHLFSKISSRKPVRKPVAYYDSKAVKVNPNIDPLTNRIRIYEKSYPTLLAREKSLQSKIKKVTDRLSQIDSDINRMELSKLTKELDNIQSEMKQVDIDIYEGLDENSRLYFSDICRTFNELSTCDKRWIINSVTNNYEAKSSIGTHVQRELIRFTSGSYGHIRSSEPVPVFDNMRGTKYYFYPLFLLRVPFTKEISAIPMSKVRLTFVPQRFVEEGSIPRDSRVIDKTWKYVNKNGDPDRRYSINPMYNVVRYGNINIEPIHITYQISNADKAKQFVETFNNYYRTLNIIQDNTETVERDYHESSHKALVDVVNSIADLYKKLESDDSFVSTLLKKVDLELGDDGFTDKKKCLILLIVDCIKCYHELGHSASVQSQEGMALAMVIAKVLKPELDLYTVPSKQIASVVSPSFQNIINQLEAGNNNYGPHDFGIAKGLEEYDTNYYKQYLVLLYRFASLVAKADNTITEKESVWLSEMLRISNTTEKNDKSLKREDVIKTRTSTTRVRRSDAKKELDSLIGLSSVKEEISSLSNFISIQQKRESLGMKTSTPSYHCVFTGNPGTGKTSVARIVAQIYKDLGILKSGHLVETDRAGLVAEYVGQTAVKTNKIIDSALDGVLFIDEAYSLIGGGPSDYGKEAIATLLKRVEDDRERLVVILAGYSKEMKEFIETNPGLQSRFNRYIEFPDYSSDELLQIFEYNMKQCQYSISNEARERLYSIIEKAVSTKDENFGNARYIRNIFEKVIEIQANRLSSETDLTSEKLSSLELDDIKQLDD